MRDLDIEQPAALESYLREAGRLDPREPFRMEVLHGGVSNRTVLVRKAGGEEWVLKQALAKLRVGVDWLSSPERVHREALGLRWLGDLAPPGAIPRFVFEDHEHHLLAMAAVPLPHANWKTVLLAGGLTTAHVEECGRLLATIHLQAWRRRREVEPAFADTRFFESLRLEPYYCYAADQVPAAAAFLRALVEQTRLRRITLVHGDFSPKNLLLRHDRLILLDHEVIHWGDPAFDLGFSLAHLLSKAHHLREQREAFSVAAGRYWEVYAHGITEAPWRESLESRAVEHALGCLMARVAGRSLLEYLSAPERSSQQAAVLKLILTLPATVPELARRFISCL